MDYAGNLLIHTLWLQLNAHKGAQSTTELQKNWDVTNGAVIAQEKALDAL
jgi:hypothetical protein